MLESVDAVKRILKCITLTKCQQHFQIFCLRNNIFRMRTARGKRKLCNVVILCGGLLIKPITENAHCKDKLVSFHYTQTF